MKLFWSVFYSALILQTSNLLASARFTKSEALEKCFTQNPKTNEWKRTCSSWDEFVKNVSTKDLLPEHRLLFSQLAIQEIQRLRELQLVLPPPKPRTVSRPVFIPDPEFDRSSLSKKELFSLFDQSEKILETETLGDHHHSIYTIDPVESEFFKNTESIVKLIESWLAPLDHGANVLQADAAFLKVMTYGESLRFEKSMSLIKSRWKEISSSTQRQRQIYERVAFWTKTFGAIPLRDWFYDEMVRVRPSKITGRRPIELFYYLESLRMSQPNLDSKVAVDSVLKTLRNLWVVHTSKEEREQILLMASNLRLRSKFLPPELEDLQPEELLLHVQSLVRRLDGEAALRAVSQILKDSHKDKLTSDNLWETFLVHIRILRIMDRRTEIPELINAYSQRGNYFNLTSPSSNAEKSARRLFEIAKLEWTYGSHEKSLGILQRLQSFSKEKSLSKNLLAEMTYVRARILEQGKEKDLADVAISDALKLKILTREQEYDLRWRQFFLRLNKAYEKREFSNLGSELEALEPLTRSDAFQVLRYQYWKATLALYQENKKLAKEMFTSVYSKEPMSYYGNLSALSLQALGESVANWKKPAQAEVSEPDWSEFVKDNGEAKNSSYKMLGRALFLMRAGASDWIPESLDDLSSQLWTYAPAKKSGSVESRLKYIRSAMWLFTDAGEPMSALRAADIVVTQLKEESPYDLKYLYPLAYWDLIQDNANKRKVDPWFTVSLIRQESAFKVNARSWANALGLMQMIPPVAQNEAKLMGMETFDYESLLNDPKLSIQLGTHHLSGLLKRFDGSWMCVLAGYNAGSPPVVDWLKYYPSPIPLTFVERISYTETRLYVMTIFRNYMNYKRIYGDAKLSLAELTQIPRK